MQKKLVQDPNLIMKKNSKESNDSKTTKQKMTKPKDTTFLGLGLALGVEGWKMLS